MPDPGKARGFRDRYEAAYGKRSASDWRAGL